MRLAAFDIGGSAVKYGLYEAGKLTQQGAFTTPTTFTLLEEEMERVMQSYGLGVSGIAISAPGAVNVAQRRIDGVSAVPYLHNFPIFRALEERFRLPVTIENDANCAGLCEMKIGVGKDVQHAAFIVLGTGVGGSIFIDRKLYKGAHLFGGEFGFMKNETPKIASFDATLVKAAKRYRVQVAATEPIDGKALFKRAQAGDAIAAGILSDMYDRIAALAYNIQVALDPEMLILGGGMSAQREIVEEISERLGQKLATQGAFDIMPRIAACAYGNDANLLGAAFNFEGNMVQR